MAVAASILTSIYHMLKDGTTAGLVKPWLTKPVGVFRYGLGDVRAIKQAHEAAAGSRPYRSRGMAVVQA
jgi:hypothetical protein